MKSEKEKPLNLPRGKKQKELFDRIEMINKKLENNYELKIISIERWEKTYIPLLNKILNNQMFYDEYQIVNDCLDKIENDLHQKKDSCTNRLKNLLNEDYGNYEKFDF